VRIAIPVRQAQSCKLLPPPPATLGAASVGLVLEEAGEDIVSVLAVPPAVGVVVATGAGSGVTACNCGAGAPIADAGVGAGAGAGAGGGVGTIDTFFLVEGGSEVVEAAANSADIC
jgi:hypothetical protein